MRRSHVFAGLLAALVAGAALAQADVPETWYAQTLTTGEAGISVTHMWSKGQWLRAETVVAGHKAVTIVRDETYYAYDELTGEGLAIEREPEAIERARQRLRPFGDEYRVLLEQGAEKVREEAMLGRRVGVYRITDEAGKRELWVTEDDTRIPIRLEVFDRAKGMETVTQWVNWQSDFRIPDVFFQPDPRTKLEQLDYAEYLSRSANEGTVGPVPVLFLRLLLTRKDK